MYLHLGQSVAVPHREILGIFDLDNASWAYKTREFLERAEQEGRVISVCDDLPRSFVLVGEEKGTATVYISQLSSAALLRRAESNLEYMPPVPTLSAWGSSSRLMVRLSPSSKTAARKAPSSRRI